MEFKFVKEPSNNPIARKRLFKELEAINQSENVPFTAGLVDDDDPYNWQLSIEGPADTIYDGYHFLATLRFPEDYPMQPPKMTFTTRMYHPNIFSSGDVCISILNSPGPSYSSENESIKDDGWKPSLGAKEIVLSVLSLLTDPNHSSPANHEASQEYQNNYVAYKKKVIRYLEESNT